jgi:hypothetical protein
MRRLARTLLCSLALSAAVCCGVAGAESYEALWFSKGDATPSRKVSLQVQGEREAPADKIYVLACEIETELQYRNALVTMKVADPDGKAVLEGSQEMPLAKGANRCTFELDPAALAPAKYTATFEVQYTEREKPALFSAGLRRVSSAALDATLGAAMATLASANEGDSESKPNYLMLRTRIAKDIGAHAAEDAAAGRWRRYAEKVDYADSVARGAGAGAVFSGVMPEIATAPEAHSMAGVRPVNGGYAAGDKPVFLFGATAPDAAAAARLKRYGLNYALVTVRPADALDPDVDKDLNAAYGPMLDAIHKENLAFGVALDAGGLTGWPLERWPQANAEGFVNLAREDVQALVARHLQAVIPYIAKQANVVGASLFNAPQFKFEGEAVHRRFIDEVQEVNPDRQKLNALWSAHLASFEDITVWGKFVDGRPDPKIPEHHYENKRAYKFDWQAFHQRLMAEYLESVRAMAQGLAPDLPLSVTMPDTAFEKNEVIHSPDREVQARNLAFTSCTLTAGALDPVYATGYPHADASLTLLQALDTSKPVNVEQLHAPIDDTMEPSDIYNFVQTLVWDGVISGADAMALPVDSEIFAHPSALEAYATAAMDINRLAPIVTGLQHARTDVAIMYSDSSKILDGGDPHLKSTSFAFEGCGFSGLTVRFVTERQCTEGLLEQAKILVLPDIPALRTDTFVKLEEFVDGGGVAARVGAPIPYDEHGRSRTSVLRNTARTIIVRGMNLPTEYLHAMDGVNQIKKLPPIPRPINAYEYPMEGVKTRFAEVDGVPYIYIVNLRKDDVNCFLSGSLQRGRDILGGKDITFPAYIEPLHPMLVRLDVDVHKAVVEPVAANENERKRK